MQKLSRKGLAFLAILMIAMTAPILGAEAKTGIFLGAGGGMAWANQDLTYYRQLGEQLPATDLEQGFNFEYVHLGYNFLENVGVSLQYGSGTGDGSDTTIGGVPFEVDQWRQDYLALNIRGTYGAMDALDLYAELGGGYYWFYMEGSAYGDEWEADVDPVVGYRAAIGANYFIDNFYVGGELSYHMADYGDATIDVTYAEGGSDSWNYQFDERINVMLLQIKLGYMFPI